MNHVEKKDMYDRRIDDQCEQVLTSIQRGPWWSPVPRPTRDQNTSLVASDLAALSIIPPITATSSSPA